MAHLTSHWCLLAEREVPVVRPSRTQRTQLMRDAAPPRTAATGQVIARATARGTPEGPGGQDGPGGPVAPVAPRIPTVPPGPALERRIWVYRECYGGLSRTCLVFVIDHGFSASPVVRLPPLGDLLDVRVLSPEAVTTLADRCHVSTVEYRSSYWGDAVL